MRLNENTGSVNVTLADSDLREINEAATKIQVQGERCPEALEKRTGL